MNKKYLVAYVIRNKKDADMDYYKVFVDNDNNKLEATNFYKGLLKRDDLYTANLCEILASTDY